MFKDLLEEYREDYGVPTDELSESETAEYLKYIELAQLKEQNRHLSAIRKIIVWGVGISLVCAAICFLAGILLFMGTNQVAAFLSFAFMIVFAVLAGKVLSLRE